MIVKVKKLKFVFYCSLVLILIFNLAFAINYRINNKSLGALGTLNLQVGLQNLETSVDGNVIIEENNLFKKFTITCDKEINQINWNEKNAEVNIILGKENLEKPVIKGNKKQESKDIYYSTNNEGVILTIKKATENNNIVMEDKNNKKNIIVFISKVSNPFSHTVVLDPGHGGQDKGCNFNDLYEKDINLKIANFTAQTLLYNGVKVIQTRDTDKLLSLKEVGNVTNASYADIFISIHINYNEDSKYKGVTTYYYDPNGFQKDERIKLAKTIQKELTKKDNWDDRGVLRQNFAVLRYSNIPAVLIECGFLSNSEDRDKLTKETVLKNFSENISKGVLNYFNSPQQTK